MYNVKGQIMKFMKHLQELEENIQPGIEMDRERLRGEQDSRCCSLDS